MRVADCDGKRVRRIGALEVRRRQQDADHGLHLRLLGVTASDDRFLDEVGGILADRQPAPRRRHQHNAARLAKLQSRARAGGNERLFDGSFIGMELVKYALDAAVQLHQPFRQAVIDSRLNGAGCHIDETVTDALDHAPAAAPQPGIDTDDSHCFRHEPPLREGWKPTKSEVNKTKTSVDTYKLVQFDSSFAATRNRPASRSGDIAAMSTQDSSGGVLDFSPIGMGRVYLWTVIGTLGCAAVALGIDSFNFHNLTQPQLLRAIAMNTLLPLGLAGPLLFFLLGKMRELSLAQQHLAVLASTDSLTGLLNRHGFTVAVESAMRRDAGEPLQRGALLIADADNFKHINDRFGHVIGDSALQLLADTMLRILRPEDRLGRIGGEEFAIYLPGLSWLAAETASAAPRSSIPPALPNCAGRPTRSSTAPRRKAETALPSPPSRQDWGSRQRPRRRAWPPLRR